MKNNNLKYVIGIVVLSLFFSSCVVVRPGEVGVKRKLGKLKDKVYEPGLTVINPFTTRLIKIPVRSVNLEVKLNLPSKEGLNVSSEISILYHIKADMAPKIIKEIGSNYERVVILSVFRSASADVCAQFFAKDMHSGKRSEIEKKIKNKMDNLLADRGFLIESVLMKSISLPPGLYNAIEDKLEAEQEAQRMEFILQREHQEAERRKIEAEGIRDAQQILSSGLNDHIIQWRSLEVLDNLSNSNNSKLIITDGKSPVLINE